LHFFCAIIWLARQVAELHYAASPQPVRKPVPVFNLDLCLHSDAGGSVVLRSIAQGSG
jgi:hypothetical protein